MNTTTRIPTAFETATPVIPGNLTAAQLRIEATGLFQRASNIDAAHGSYLLADFYRRTAVAYRAEADRLQAVSA